MAITATGVVKDVETAVMGLDRLGKQSVMMITGAANGASVVFSLYGRVNASAWIGPVEMTNPLSSGSPVTALTGVSKAGVSSDLLAGFTEVWAKRTDADASTAATVYLSAVSL